MASLTAKSAAEMLALPAHSQMRVLTAQKYPKDGSQAFRVPYYSTAINGMKAFFRNGRSPAALEKTRMKVQKLAQSAKRDNNLRVINAFENSQFSCRDLDVSKSPHLRAAIGDVEVKLSPDLRVTEASNAKVIYINCKAESINVELARRTLEIAHWVLEMAGHKLPMIAFEYIDLSMDEIYVFKTRRKKTITAMRENAKVIATLWQSL